SVLTGRCLCRSALTRLASIVLVDFAGRAARADEIRAVSGRFTETVVSIAQEDGRAIVRTAEKRELRLETVKTIRFSGEEPLLPKGAKVLLANGDELRGEIGDS